MYVSGTTGYEMAAHLKQEKQRFDLTPAVQVET